MIDIQHAYKTYPGDVHALRDVNLKIDKGDFVFLIGSSGAGKTTLFKLLSAYDRPTSGSVNVLGFELDTLGPDRIPFFRRHIGVIYQDFRLLKKQTVFENVALPLEIRNEKRRYINSRVEELLDSVGLSHKRESFPEHLSGGEQQRVAIARALVHRPSLLIADEPTGNLDPSLSGDIVELLEKVNAQGTTVFVATHDHELVKKSHREVLKLDAGRLTGGVV